MGLVIAEEPTPTPCVCSTAVLCYCAEYMRALSYLAHVKVPVFSVMHTTSDSSSSVKEN